MYARVHGMGWTRSKKRSDARKSKNARRVLTLFAIVSLACIRLHE